MWLIADFLPKHNLKPRLVQYIYCISYKIAKKKTNPENGFAIFEKRYPKKFRASKTCHISRIQMLDNRKAGPSLTDIIIYNV